MQKHQAKKWQDINIFEKPQNEDKSVDNSQYVAKLEKTIRDIKQRVIKFLQQHLNNNLNLQDVIDRLEENGSLTEICNRWS